MSIDVNRIINGTPYKRILNGYETMKSNYNTESAKAYYAIYSKENLSDILENSKLIFSEPYNGLDFYKSIVLESSSCIFTQLNDELNKVKDFMTENANGMSDSQKELYTKFLDEFKDYVEKTSDIILISSYLKDKDNNVFEKELSNLIYKEKIDDNIDGSEVFSYLKENADLKLIFTYAPFIYEKVDRVDKLNSLITEMTSNELDNTNWSSYVYNTAIMNICIY